MSNIGPNNKALAEQVLAALAAGDMNAVLSIAADDFEYRVMSVQIQVYSREVLVKTMNEFSTLMKKSVSFTIVAATAEADRVAIEAEGDGLTAAGKPYRNRYHFAFEFRTGKLVRMKEYMDTAYAAQTFAPA
jgi:ketosteroid isomerase-like protein